MSESDDDTALNHRQQAALALLATGAPVPAVAKAIGVSERAVWNWLKLEPFKTELRAHQRQGLESASRKLQHASLAAVQALETVMGDEEAPHSARVSAAKAVLDAAYRASELANLTERLEQLEAEVAK